MSLNKFTDAEAIEKVRVIYNDLRNCKTDKYKDMDFDERLSYVVALAQVINIATAVIEAPKTTPKKSSTEILLEVLSERKVQNG